MQDTHNHLIFYAFCAVAGAVGIETAHIYHQRVDDKLLATLSDTESALAMEPTLTDCRDFETGLHYEGSSIDADGVQTQGHMSIIIDSREVARSPGCRDLEIGFMFRIGDSLWMCVETGAGLRHLMEFPKSNVRPLNPSQYQAREFRPESEPNAALTDGQ